jgi:hypothetical protein
MDAAGNVTFTGSTVSNDFPTTAGAFDTSYNGGDYLSDVFVTRLNPTGSALIYSTFLGGSDDDYGNCLALDALGNATFVGETRSKDFPITADAFDTSQNGDVDVFVTRLNSAGSDLLYSTFFGGTSSEAAYSLALDSSGSATFTGTAYSLDFPITAGAYDTSQNGNWDVFISRLSLDGRVVFLPLIRK